MVINSIHLVIRTELLIFIRYIGGLFNRDSSAEPHQENMWPVHTTKLAQARPRPGLGSVQVYVVSTVQR